MIEIEKYQQKLKAYSRKLVKNNYLADDLLQETNLKALINYSKFDGRNLNTWLHTIMFNEFINSCRRKKFDFDEINTLMEERIKDKQPNQISILSNKDIINKISTLKKTYRIPFEMLVKGYKYHEIAHYLSLPEGTVKSRIFKARKDLIQYIEK